MSMFRLQIAVAGEVGSSISTYHRGPGLPEWLYYHGSNGFWDPDYGSEYAGGAMNFFIASNNLGETLIPGAGPLRSRRSDAASADQAIRRISGLFPAAIVYHSCLGKTAETPVRLIEKHRYSPIE